MMGGNSSPPASGRNGRVTVTNRINTGLSGVFTVTSEGYIMVTVTFGPPAGTFRASPLRTMRAVTTSFHYRLQIADDCRLGKAADWKATDKVRLTWGQRSLPVQAQAYDR